MSRFRPAEDKIKRDNLVAWWFPRLPAQIIAGSAKGSWVIVRQFKAATMEATGERGRRHRRALATNKQNCENGDPGAQGCSGAARMYEERGEIWMVVHRKAYGLENGAGGRR